MEINTKTVLMYSYFKEYSTAPPQKGHNINSREQEESFRLKY
jgi:hypothetical protein